MATDEGHLAEKNVRFTQCSQVANIRGFPVTFNLFDVMFVVARKPGRSTW